MPGEPNQVLWRGVRPVEGIRGVWPARNATRVSAFGEAAGDTTISIYTVPAGKILFISSCQLSTRLSATESKYAMIYSRTEVDTTHIRIFRQNVRIPGTVSNQLGFFPALQLGPGYELLIVSNSNSIEAYGVAHGWLEDE